MYLQWKILWIKCMNNVVWSLSATPHLSYPSVESKISLLLPVIHPDITVTFSERTFSGQGWLFVKPMRTKLHLMKCAVHWRHFVFSSIHLPMWHPRTKSPPTTYICSRKKEKKKKQKLQTVVTYHFYSPTPSKAMQRRGTAATSLCQLGALSGGDAPGGTADVCTDGHFSPALALAGALSRNFCWVELSHHVLQPPLSSAVPFCRELCCCAPNTSIGWTLQAPNSFATGIKASAAFLKGQLRNQQKQWEKGHSQAVSVARERREGRKEGKRKKEKEKKEKGKIYNWYKNRVLQDFISPYRTD